MLEMWLARAVEDDPCNSLGHYSVIVIDWPMCLAVKLFFQTVFDFELLFVCR